MADGLLSSALGAIDRTKQALGARFGLLASNPEEFARQLAAEARQRAGVGLLGEPKTAEEMASGAWINTPYGMQAMQAGSGFVGSIKPVGNVPIKQVIEDYRGSHKAPSPEFGAPLYDLTGGGQMYPADVYSSKATQYYGTGYPKADREAFALASKVRGNPEAEVTMYRAVPKDKNITSINVGDWVSLSKDYAKTHGESALKGNYKIIEQKVKAKDLWTNADSIHEFGYHPSK